MRNADNKLTDNGHKQAAQTSLQLLPLIMNNIPQAVFWKDQNLVYLGCNQAFADDAGFSSPEGVIGKTDFDMPWKDQAELYRADDRHVLDCGEPKLSYEEPQTTPTGSTTWLRTSKIPVQEKGQVVAILGMYEDITAYKKAQETSEIEKQRFHMILETVRVPTIISRLSDGIVLYANQAIADISQVRLEKLIGFKTGNFYVNPDDQQKIRDALRGPGHIDDYEVQFKRTDGSTYWALLSSRIIDYEDEKCVLSTYVDITARKQAEADLLLRDRALASSLSAVLIAGLDFKPIYVNESLLKMTGYTHEEAMRLAVTDLTGDPEGLKRIDEATRTQSFFLGEEPIKRKDGSIFPANFSTSYITNAEGKPIAIQTSFSDITARKQMEARLNESEERYRRLSDATVEGIVIHDKGILLDASEAFAKMFGYELSEVIGMPATEFLTPETREITMQNIRTGYERPYEVVGLRKDGSTFPVEITGKAIPYEGRTVRVTALRDITERKQAEAQAQQEKALSDAIINSLPGVFYMFDTEGRFVRWNKNYEKMLGMTTEEVASSDLATGVAEEDLPALNAAIEKTLAENVPASAEATIISQSGERIPYYFTGNSVTLGDQVYVLGVGQDITERKRAEAQLQQEKSLSDAIINGLPGTFYLFDLQGRMIRWNKQYEKVSGYTAEEIPTMSVIDTLAEEDRESALATIQRAMVEGQGAVEANFVTKDGRRIPYYFAGQRLQIDDQVYMAGTGMDLTERKRAEQDLRENQQLLQLVMDNIPQAVFWKDRNLSYLGVNQSFAEDAGYTSPQELVGKNDFDMPWKEQAELYRADDRRVFELGETKLNYEEPQTSSTGEITWLRTSKIPMRDTNGQIFAVLGMYEDITERKRLEAQVREAFERRGLQVELSTQVSQSIASASNLGELYERVVTQVKDQFGYYHTQLLRYDPAQEAVVLVTGYGETGEKMLAAGHRLPMGQGLIGTAAASGETVLRPALENDPDWHPNPLLPETKGEIAVPIKLGNTVLGVLDVQSNVTSTLDADDQLLLEGLCGQIAIAIESTRLREEMSERLEEINRLYRATSHEGWQAYRQSTEVSSGFVYDQAGLRPAENTGLVEELFATVPLTVPGGEVIGNLAIADDSQRPLSAEDVSFLQQVSEQVALALESARLFEQTQEALTWQQAINQTSILIGQAKGVPEIVRATAELLPLLEMVSCSINLIKETDANGAPIVSDIHIVRFENGQYESRPSVLNQPTVGWLPDDPIYYQRNRVTVFPNLDDLTTMTPPDAFKPSGSVAYMRQAGMRSAITLALGVQNRPIGYLTFNSRQPLAHVPDKYIAWLGTIVDLISTSIDSQMLLNETEQARQALGEVMNVAGMANWELDLETFVFTYNDRLYQMLGTTAEEEGGYEMSAEKYVGTYIHPDDAGLIMGAIQAGLQSTNPQDFKGSLEYRMIRKDGEMRYMLTDYRLIVNEQGKPVAGVGSFLDITQRKKAELAVQESERRYQQILDAITDMVLVKGEKASIVWANKTFREYYGMTNEQLQGMIDAPIVEPDYTLQYVKDDAYVFETGNILSIPEEPVTRYDGVTFPFETVKAPIRDIDGKIVMTVGVSRDITERKRVQEALAKQASELETVAQVSTTVSSVLDPDKLLQYVVDLTKERFGLYHAHIYTYDEAWNTLLLASGAGEVGRKLVAEEHAIPLTLEQSLVARAARDRKAVIVNDVNSEPGFLPNPLLPETCAEMAIPMIVGDKLLGVFDVQSSNAEGFSDRDANIYVTLATQVGVALQNARSYAEQAALVTQLRELDRLKSSFLANMSHELRTPLNSILGFADVIIEELDGPLTENMTNDLRLIQKNGQHLLHLINDVLDMAKIEAGRMNLNPEKFTAIEVLDEVTSITSTLASEKNLALFIDPESNKDVKIYADRTRLRQVMINLVNNAIKFTENGKISLKLVALEGAQVLFTIKDTGIGIPPDKLEAVFQEFTQVDSSTTRKVGGTGLGLPISRRLVEMHGGRLWAESTGVPGEGSTFFVELPVEARITDIVEK